ncbi:MAG: HAMP domain-containing sensor histidine kinase [Patescibacteria group bacterium]
MLKFENNKIEKAYHEKALALSYQRLKISCFLGGLLIPIYAILDWFYVDPLYYEMFWIIRLCISIILFIIVGFAYYFKDYFTRNSRVWNGIAYFTTAAGIIVMIQLLEGYASPYYVGFGLVLLFAGQLAPFSFKQGFLVCGAIWLFYYISIFLFNDIENIPIFVNNSFFITTITFLSILSLYLWEQLRRREFLAQYELKKLSEELDLKVKDRTKELASSLAREKDISAFKDQFLNVASHQLRTPTTAINWILEQANIKKWPKKEYINLSENIEQLTKSLDDLLIITEIGMNYKVKKKQEVDLETLITKILGRLNSRIKNKKLNINFIKQKKAVLISADSWALDIAVREIIENAIFYSRERGEININITEKNNNIILSVRDEGIGIPKEDQSIIFNKFHRSKTAIKHHPIGTGFGLFISQIIINAHKGKIWVKSVENKGSTFYIQLSKKY